MLKHFSQIVNLAKINDQVQIFHFNIYFSKDHVQFRPKWDLQKKSLTFSSIVCLTAWEVAHKLPRQVKTGVSISKFLLCGSVAA